MQVRDVMTSPAITVSADTHIPELARLMRVNQISGMPVIDDAGKLLGIVTDHDLILRNAPVREPRYFSVLSGVIPLNPDEYRHYRDQLRHVSAITAGELTEPGIETTTPDTPLEQVMETMLDPKITILPVLENDTVVGIVTRTDLVRLVERLEGAIDPTKEEAIVDQRLIAGLVQVILYVDNMSLMVEYYRDKLGFEVEVPAGLDDYSAETFVILDAGTVKLALNSGGHGNIGEDAPMIVFGVTDIDTVRATLVERGVALEEIFDAGAGIRACQGRDPEGNPISLEARP